MNRDKQIEEMARVMCQRSKPCILCAIQAPCRCRTDAELLNAEGYRKDSDIAREIIEEIDRMIYKLLNDSHYIMGDMCYEIAELKKKYTEEGK